MNPILDLEAFENAEEILDQLDTRRNIVEDHGRALLASILALDDFEFKKRYRMSKESFNNLVQKVIL